MMLVYGMGGVGKTTFAASFPKPLLIDFENGAKYFGERGISVDVAQQKDWFNQEDFNTLKQAVANYETIIIDPVGEAMQKLINSPSITGAKYRQGGTGDLTMAGWGKVKDNMRNFIKWLRDTNKNVVIVAHVDETMDGEQIVRRPLIATKLSDELITMVDIVAYMGTVTAKNDETGENESKRVLFLDPSDESRVSKDRTGKLGKYIKPEYSYIANQLGHSATDTNQGASDAQNPQNSSENSSNSSETAQNDQTPASAQKPAENGSQEVELSDMTHAELSEKAKSMGLPYSGTKTDLIVRITQAQNG